MKFVLINIGKTIDIHLSSLQEQYQNRLKHYLSFEVVNIPELKNTKNLSASEQAAKESESILKKLEVGDNVILLDERGTEFSSIEFADFLSKKMHSSNKRIVFVTGGAYGFSEELYRRANDMVSLSRMTFSHQMVRLIFVEQLYRAMTILKGEPYHHA
ncbi:MAG TPA: 23S rRNA (pseudouridine(1915)-N(3))-methyltransferase RlmH [Paludibacteraceae bacterium]|jgi:23S rRNA (pseudouridine1915-N3)-methyltransferase|nr:23S rRNA (pseudouridine(1915)-N(3))-methyltransferase RlmH [Paludibacteraceae bacterium]HOH54790.1 23S rRNA (pseudouridine(1915)-N(3))-methyltransferase RlmH [Paludibacteraceae bacterium]